MQRGKTDSVAAQRIAEYAYRFRNQMRLWTPPRQAIQQLSLVRFVNGSIRLITRWPVGHLGQVVIITK